MEEILIAQDAMLFFADHARELKKNGIRVAFKLLSLVDFGNRLQIDPAEIGKDLEIKLPVVQKAIQQLVELKVISEGPKVRQTGLYRFNPGMAWRGDLEDQPEALEEWHRRENIKVVGETEPLESEPAPATKKPRKPRVKARAAQVVNLSERKANQAAKTPASSTEEDTNIP